MDSNRSRHNCVSYIVHSTFTLIFPLHIGVLLVSNQGYTVKNIFQTLSITLARHMQPSKVSSTTHNGNLSLARFFTFIFILTIGVTTPGLLWFAAVSLAP
jgi:hypothetical protein